MHTVEQRDIDKPLDDTPAAQRPEPLIAEAAAKVRAHAERWAELDRVETAPTAEAVAEFQAASRRFLDHPSTERSQRQAPD